MSINDQPIFYIRFLYVLRYLLGYENYVACPSCGSVSLLTNDKDFGDIYICPKEKAIVKDYGDIIVVYT